jgi:hypothetical protein
MKTYVLALGVAFALSSVAWPAHGQTELRVDGKMSPSSCDIKLREGILDFGVISVASLDPDETKPTPVKEDRGDHVDITCTGPSRFMFRASDLSAGGGNGRELFGLGLGSNGKAVGGFVITEYHDGFNGDGKRAYLTASSDLQTWSPSSNSAMPFSQSDYYLGLTKTEGSTGGPDYLTSATLWLQVNVTVAPKRDLVLTDELALAGNVAFEIRYY